MPDLPDDLAALLRARAERAPAVPAPTAALVRAVRRRHAVRVAALGAGVAAAVVAVTAVGAAATRPARTVAPVSGSHPTESPSPSPSPYDDKYEFCALGSPAPTLYVSVTSREMKFDHGCYVVAAGATKVTFVNQVVIPHGLGIAPEGGRLFFKTDTVGKGLPNGTTWRKTLVHPLEAGDYELICTIHDSMRAMLVVR